MTKKEKYTFDDNEYLVLKTQQKNTIIHQIFSEIDSAIEKCQCSNPRSWNDSQFKKYYSEIKKRWMK